MELMCTELCSGLIPTGYTDVTVLANIKRDRSNPQFDGEHIFLKSKSSIAALWKCWDLSLQPSGH